VNIRFRASKGESPFETHRFGFTLDREQTAVIASGTFLHDIGKIAIPDRILCAIMPAIWLQVVMIGSNRQRNFAEMPLGIEVIVTPIT
jgi:hypothetical protein